MSPDVAGATRPFVDINVLLTLISSDAAKATRAEALLGGHIVVSVQVLNEFANVARRKHCLDWAELTQALADIRHFAEVRPVSIHTHEAGLRLSERYQLGLYDAMIAAAATEAGCDTLLSEDFHAEQVFDGRLTVRNTFAPNGPSRKLAKR